MLTLVLENGDNSRLTQVGKEYLLPQKESVPQ